MRGVEALRKCHLIKTEISLSVPRRLRATKEIAMCAPRRGDAEVVIERC